MLFYQIKLVRCMFVYINCRTMIASTYGRYIHLEKVIPNQQQYILLSILRHLDLQLVMKLLLRIPSILEMLWLELTIMTYKMVFMQLRSFWNCFMKIF